MTRLTNIRNIGRYKNTETGKEYNIKAGMNKQLCVYIFLYLYRGKRQFISVKDFYSIYKKVQ